MSAIVDPNGRIMAWNEKAEILTGYEANELEGLTIHALISEAGYNEGLTDTENLWATLKTKAGKLPVFFTVNSLRKSDDSVLGYHITMCLKESEVKTDNSSDTQTAMDIFMTMHEFQEPVRRILMHADMLKNDPWDKNATLKSAEKIRKDAGHILTWIQDMLNFARTTNSNVGNEKIPLAAVIEAVQQTQNEKGTVVNVTTKLPYVTGSRIQLIQLFSNLIQNAVKYNTNRPHIYISSHPVNNKQIGNRFGSWYAVSVQDNGIGFNPERSRDIFNLFTRAHTSADYPGYGIGLALCMQIAQAHGGTIEAESEPGKGSVFTVYFPAK